MSSTAIARLAKVGEGVALALAINMVWLLLWVRPFLGALWRQQHVIDVNLWLSFGNPIDFWILVGSIGVWFVLSLVLVVEELTRRFLIYHDGKDETHHYISPRQIWGLLNLVASIGVIAWIVLIERHMLASIY